MMETAAQRKQKEQEKILERDREVAAKFAKLGQWKKELDDKLAKKTADMLAAKVNNYCILIRLYCSL